MADSTEFEDKLKEIGYPDPTEPVASFDPSLSNPPQSAPSNSDMDKLDSIRLEAARANNLQPNPAPEPPLGIHQESGANGGEFPEVRPVQPGGSSKGNSTENTTNEHSAALPEPVKNTVDQAIQNPYIRQYLKSKYGFGPELDDAALKVAQNKAATNKALTRVGAGLDQIGAGFAGVKQDTKYYDDAAKEQDQPVENILQRREGIKQNNKLVGEQNATQGQLDSDDPASQKSQVARQVYLPILQKLGFPEDAMNSLQNASESTIKQVVEKPAQFMQTAKLHQLQADQLKDYRDEKLAVDREKLKALGDQKAAAATYKEEKQNNDRITKFQDALDPNKARAGNLADSQKRFNSAERLEGLVSQVGTGENLDRRQIEELAIGLNSLLAPGTPAASITKELVPSTAQGNTQKIVEWLTNEPRGLNQQKFVQNMLGTVQREKAISADQRSEAQLQRVAAYEDLLKHKNPDVQASAQNVLYNYGISPGQYDQFKQGRRGGSKPGVDIKNLSTASAPATPTQMASAQEDTVKVVSPEGKAGTIPKANLDKALQRGFKVVQ